MLPLSRIFQSFELACSIAFRCSPLLRNAFLSHNNHFRKVFDNCWTPGVSPRAPLRAHHHGHFKAVWRQYQADMPISTKSMKYVPKWAAPTLCWGLQTFTKLFSRLQHIVWVPLDTCTSATWQLDAEPQLLYLTPLIRSTQKMQHIASNRAYFCIYREACVR